MHPIILFFFFNDTATTEIYTLSLHDALPIFIEADEYDTAFFDKRSKFVHYRPRTAVLNNLEFDQDRKSTRLNSSHSQISYAVFCLKKKKKKIQKSHNIGHHSAKNKTTCKECI